MVKLRHIALSVMLCSGCTADTVEPLNASNPDIKQIEAQAKATSGPGIPALWMGSDADTKIFIFGTVHNLRADNQWMTDQIASALKASQTLYLETDLSSQAARKAIDDFHLRHGELPTGESLYHHLDTGDAYRLKHVLKNLGEDPESMTHLQPWLAALRVSQLRMERAGYLAGQGVDSALEQQARDTEKVIAYLEPVQEQLNLFDKAAMGAQIKSLNQITRDMDRTLEYMDLIASEWLDGDIEGLGLLVANPDWGYGEDDYAVILSDRNQKWADKINTLMDQPGTYFLAVGAAHLAGPDSLIFMLKDKNIRMERVQ